MSDIRYESGESPDANYLATKLRETTRHLHTSQAIGNADVLRGELGEVWDECREPDWDGHEAFAVTQNVLRNAYIFLESLPLGFPRPSLGADPNGHITVEWYRNPRRQVSIAVDDDGVLHYAAIIGPNTTYGTEVCYGDIPERVVGLVNRVYS